MSSVSTRLTRLLDRGFYPVELPPSFRTRHFSRVRKTFNPPHSYYGSTTFFDGATFRGVLRAFGIINPASYFLLASFIADNWSSFAKVYRLSSSSGARPKFPPLGSGGRAIEVASLAVKNRSIRHLASSFPIILNLDINRFYGSIYSHSLPWAALGKQEAKRRFRNGNLQGHWSDTLDRLIRNCNQRQTVGIPIGPDTSRIISELVLSRIDAELTARGSGIGPKQIFHNIDDYQIGAFEGAKIEDAQSQFVRTIDKYELRLNDFKTSVGQGLELAPSNFQLEFDVLRAKRGRNFVEHFFEILYSQITLNPDSNVLGYALKSFASSLSSNPEKELVREYLQRLILAAPHQVRWIFPLLLGIYQLTGINRDVARMIIWGAETCARRNDVGNLLWFLYGAVFLKIKFDRSVCDQCIGMSNELVDLVLFHGRHLGLFKFPVRKLRDRYLGADFQTPSWLPLYEVQRRGWDSSLAFSKLGGPDDHHGLYDHLRANRVEFYITDAEFYTAKAFTGWKLKEDVVKEGSSDNTRDYDTGRGQSGSSDVGIDYY